MNEEYDVMNEEYEIVNAVMMYMFNVNIMTFAKDLFNEEWRTMAQHRREYIEAKYMLIFQGRLWGELDMEKRHALVGAAKRKYITKELVE